MSSLVFAHPTRTPTATLHVFNGNLGRFYNRDGGKSSSCLIAQEMKLDLNAAIFDRHCKTFCVSSEIDIFRFESMS